jgi:hypothetical protein
LSLTLSAEISRIGSATLIRRGQLLVEFMWPFSRSMKHAQNFNVIVLHAVWDNVRQSTHDKLTRSLDPSGPPDVGMFSERINAFFDQTGNSIRSLRFVRRYEFSDFNEI